MVSRQAFQLVCTPVFPSYVCAKNKIPDGPADLGVLGLPLVLDLGGGLSPLYSGDIHTILDDKPNHM